MYCAVVAGRAAAGAEGLLMFEAHDRKRRVTPERGNKNYFST
jgi:hypothetical protein